MSKMVSSFGVTSKVGTNKLFCGATLWGVGGGGMGGLTNQKKYQAVSSDLYLSFVTAKLPRPKYRV